MSGHELALIEALASRLPAPSRRVIVGVGDDAAVVNASPICLTSVDAVVEGVHFRLGEGRLSYADVGFKALGSALSDLAAMGVPPGEAYLVLGAPPGLIEEQALAVIDGVCELARQTGVSVLGGDVVSSPVLSLSVTVVGWADSTDAVVYRSGASPGDLVGVTGTLGGAGIGVALMREQIQLEPPLAASALGRARRPLPRLVEGAALAQAGVSAMIDLSDGLASDATHLGRASGVQLEIDVSLLPLEQCVAPAAPQLHTEPWRIAATAGEDYELCFCAASAKREQIEHALHRASGVGVHWIGEALPVVEGEAGARFMSEAGEVRMRGYEHRW